MLEGREFYGPPKTLFLGDVGPWGEVWRVLGNARLRAEVIKQLEMYATRDPREVYDTLQGAPFLFSSAVLFTADFLFLQRLAFSGKAVGASLEAKNCWKSAGFNGTSAYGTAKTGRFGQVLPQLPSLIRRLKDLDYLTWPRVIGGSSRLMGPSSAPLNAPVVLYIDPPYDKGTGYPDGSLPRAEVVELAKAWEATGVTVLVSEAEPIQELVDLGWEAIFLRGATADSKPFQSKKEEWLTVSPHKEKA